MMRCNKSPVHFFSKRQEGNPGTLTIPANGNNMYENLGNRRITFSLKKLMLTKGVNSAIGYFYRIV